MSAADPPTPTPDHPLHTVTITITPTFAFDSAILPVFAASAVEASFEFGKSADGAVVVNRAPSSRRTAFGGGLGSGRRTWVRPARM